MLFKSNSSPVKYILWLVVLGFSSVLVSQKGLPYFLEGTWQIENQPTFEQWDLLHDGKMLGLVYKKSVGDIKVKEYLKIELNHTDIRYIATVMGQNQGKDVLYRGIVHDSTLVIENTSHDYPQRISYSIVDSCSLMVTLTGKGYRDTSYLMFRCYPESTDNIRFNRQLARELQSDEWGMKMYYFVILATGEAHTEDKEFYSQAFRGHLDNIQKLAEIKNLIVAGPLNRNPENYRGLFILDNVFSRKEAESLLETDPAIRHGFLKPYIYEWYGSAALPLYLPYTDMIWEKKP